MGAIKVAPDPAPPANVPAAPPPGANAEQQAEMDQAAAAAAPPEAPTGYQPTEAQLAAAQKVNAEQDARAAAADALPEETKRKRYWVDSHRNINEEADDYDWKGAGGPQLEEMVQKMDLIDLRYVVPLIEAGGVMPRWQDLPKSARITVHNLWRLNTMLLLGTPLLAVLVLSYPWRASPRKSRTHATSRPKGTSHRPECSARRTQSTASTQTGWGSNCGRCCPCSSWRSPSSRSTRTTPLA